MNVFLFYGKIYHISFANRQIYQEKNMIDSNQSSAITLEKFIQFQFLRLLYFLVK